MFIKLARHFEKQKINVVLDCDRLVLRCATNRTLISQ